MGTGLMSVSRDRDSANVIAQSRALQNQSVWAKTNGQTDIKHQSDIIINKTESKSESSEPKPESSESKFSINKGIDKKMPADLKLEITEKSNLRELRSFIKKHKMNVKTGRQHSKKSNWPQIYKHIVIEWKKRTIQNNTQLNINSVLKWTKNARITKTRKRRKTKSSQRNKVYKNWNTLKNETNTFEIFSDQKLTTSSIKIKLNEHLSKEFQNITDKCEIKRVSKKKWNITLVDKMSSKWAARVESISTKLHFDIENTTGRKWTKIKSNGKNKWCVKFIIKTSIGCETRVRELMKQAVGTAWETELTNMHIQPTRNKRKNRGQYSFTCRITTNRKSNLKNALQKVRGIRPSKTNKRGIRASKNRWRIRFTTDAIIRHLNDADKVLNIMKQEGFLDQNTNTAVHNMFEILNTDDDEQIDEVDSERLESANICQETMPKKHIMATQRNTMKIGCWNTANRLRKNIGKLETYCSDKKIQLLGITEVGITRPNCNKYEFFGKIESEKNGHHSLGFLVDPLIEKSVHHVTSEMPNTVSSEWAMLSSTKSEKNNTYIGLYYVPSSDKKSGNLTKRKKTLSSIRANVSYLRKNKGKNVKIILMGDFNIHIGRMCNAE